MKTSSWENRWLPSITAILFFAQLSLSWPKGASLLEDPGTGWHLRTGQTMLETHRIVSIDPYSFTAPGNSWITFEWGSEVLFALAAKAAGLGGVVALTSLILALLPCLLLRYLIGRGIGYGTAFFYTLGALVIFQAHALARPHVFTYLFFAVLLMVFELDREGLSVRRYPVLGGLFLLWANLHGGFAAGLVYVALRLIGWIVDGGRAAWRSRIGPGITVGAICFFPTLVNPHGWLLHEKVLHTVTGLKTLSYWQEFQAPDFYGGSTLALVVWLVVGSILLCGLRGGLPRQPWESLLPLSAFMMLACKSQRHVFLLLLVAAHLVTLSWEVARTGLGFKLPDGLGRFFERQKNLCSDLRILPIMALAFLLLYPGSPSAHELVLGESRVSAGARKWIRAHLAQVKNPVTTTENGGILIYEFWPDFRVGFDDRSDFYGDVMNLEMLRLEEARPGWEKILNQYPFQSAVLSVHDPLDTVLSQIPGWSRTYQDSINTIWVRDETASFR